MNLPKIDYDKALHFIYGTVSALCGALIVSLFILLAGIPTMTYSFAILCYSAGAIVAAGGVGLWKELRDKKTPSAVYDKMDIVATAAGALPVVGGLLISLIYLM